MRAKYGAVKYYLFQGADGMGQSEGNTRRVVIARHGGPCAVEDLGTHGNTLHGNREILCSPLERDQGLHWQV